MFQDCRTFNELKNKVGLSESKIDKRIEKERMFGYDPEASFKRHMSEDVSKIDNDLMEHVNSQVFAQFQAIKNTSKYRRYDPASLRNRIQMYDDGHHQLDKSEKNDIKGSAYFKLDKRMDVAALTKKFSFKFSLMSG